jgi:hypothetical protein
MRALLLMLFEAGSFMLHFTSSGAESLYCIMVFMIAKMDIFSDMPIILGVKSIYLCFTGIRRTAPFNPEGIASHELYGSR